MNCQQTGIIILVKSALTGEKYSLPLDFDFESAFIIGKKHGIISMLYYGAINCGFEQNSEMMQKCFLHTCNCLCRSEQQSFKLKQLFDCFDKNGIDYMPVKGKMLRDLYPKPEMRPMSDADILIKKEQYGRIRELMLEMKFVEGSVTDHEIHWMNPYLHVELHSRLIPSYNKDYYDYYGEGWQLAKIHNGTHYYMTEEDFLIYLFTHFAKHYREAGIGIKHVTDLWLYLKNNPKLDESYIECELKKLQLFDFYVNIRRMISVWFENKETSPVSELLTEVIFDSGAGGTRERYLISSAYRDAKKKSALNNVRKNRLFSAIFMSYEKMCVLYPFLKKFYIALPFMWIVRLVGKVFSPRKWKTFKNDLDTISNDVVLTYQESLNFVGLDFNFKE